jgi:hypothetical protein
MIEIWKTFSLYFLEFILVFTYFSRFFLIFLKISIFEFKNHRFLISDRTDPAEFQQIWLNF